MSFEYTCYWYCLIPLPPTMTNRSRSFVGSSQAQQGRGSVFMIGKYYAPNTLILDMFKTNVVGSQQTRIRVQGAWQTQHNKIELYQQRGRLVVRSSLQIKYNSIDRSKSVYHTSNIVVQSCAVCFIALIFECKNVASFVMTIICTAFYI